MAFYHAGSFSPAFFRPEKSRKRIGALLLAGLYALFKDTILPTLTQKITNLFNYQG